MGTDFRVGFGYDSHRLAEGRALFLAGTPIESDKGCVAHSDGDAAIHALCDALLGAAGLQDIGTHFPDNDPQYKNIDSRILLEKVVQLVENQHFTVNNADLTIVIEKPKIAPYVHNMKRTLAQLLKIDETRLAVKAKSNEKMGFVGREEGVAAYAIVLLSRS